MVRWDIELSRHGGIQTMVRWDIELSRMEGYRLWLGGTLNCHGWRDTDNG